MFTKSGIRYQEHRRKHEVSECIKGLKYVLRADDHLRKSGILKKNTLSLNWAQANSLTTVIKEPMALEYRSEWYQTFFMKEYASLTLSVQPNVRRRMSMAFPGFYGIAPWHFLSKILANICFLCQLTGLIVGIYLPKFPVRNQTGRPRFANPTNWFTTVSRIVSICLLNINTGSPK